MIQLSCHGAAKQVTGSCYLIETDHARVLVDCGLFQGDRELAEETHRSLVSMPRRSLSCFSHTPTSTIAAVFPCW